MEPDITTFIIALTSCANGSLYHQGCSIHEEMQRDVNKHSMLRDVQIRATLINFYGKSGQLDNCWKIFGDEKLEKETSTWNAMIHALGRNGQIDRAMEMYRNMDSCGVGVDGKTYIALLNALSHVGEAEQAYLLWRTQITDDGIKYDRFVMTSLVDCFTRKGMLQEALNRVMEYEEKTNGCDHIMWMTLLNGCSKHPGHSIERVIVDEYAKRFDSVSVDHNQSKQIDLSELESAMSKLRCVRI